MTVDAAKVDYCDGAGVALLIDLIAQERAAPVEIANLKPAFELLLKQFDPKRVAKDIDPEVKRRPAIEEIGRAAAAVWKDIAEQITFIGELSAALFYALLRPHTVRWRDVWRVCERVGVDALPIVALISFLLGMILAFQSAVPMKRFGAEIFVADLIALGQEDGEEEADCLTVDQCLSQGDSTWYQQLLAENCGGDERLCEVLRDSAKTCWSTIQTTYPAIAARAPGSCVP